MMLLIWVKNRYDFNSFVWIGIAQFNEQRSFIKTFFHDFAWVCIDIVLDIGTNVISIESADVDSSRGLIGEVYAAGYGDNLKYFVFVGSDFDFKLHIFTESNRIDIILVDVHWLYDNWVGCTVFSLDNNYNRGLY